MTQDGVKPDPITNQAITEMRTPRDVLELQRVLGMVTYLGRFIPNSGRGLVVRVLDSEL